MSEIFNNWVDSVVGILVSTSLFGGFVGWLWNLSSKIRMVEVTVEKNSKNLYDLQSRVSKNYETIINKLQENDIRDIKQASALEALAKSMDLFSQELIEIRQLKKDFIGLSVAVESLNATTAEIKDLLNAQRIAVNAFYEKNKEIARPKEGW